MQPSQLRELIERYGRDECSPQEERFLHEWYNNIGRDLDDEFSGTESADVEERLWAALRPVEEPRRGWNLLLKAAIITLPLLMLALIGYHFPRHAASPIPSFINTHFGFSKAEPSRYYNDGNTKRHITLVDGSTITLQPKSEIIVRKHFNRRWREVELKGEAFFHVKRDPSRPFFVYAGEVVTKVLGTSFIVRAYENDKDVTVAVKTGRVSVYANRRHKTSKDRFMEPEVILTPNQQVVYHREKEVVSKDLVAKPEIILPNSNLFRMKFENAQVSEIFEVLEENYGIEIRYDKELLKNCRLTTSMSDEGLYERIEVICKAIGASYSRNEGIITIKSNGC